jgi:hypothetical protein
VEYHFTPLGQRFRTVLAAITNFQAEIDRETLQGSRAGKSKIEIRSG